MQTPFGDIAEDDIQTLEFMLEWYMKYGSKPSAKIR